MILKRLQKQRLNVVYLFICLTVGLQKPLLAIAADAADVERPLVVVFFLDGARWDMTSTNSTPNLHKLIANGVQGEMIPGWMTDSSTNHWTLATGLYPTSTGIYSNEIHNPQSGKDYDWFGADEFWRGEPIWSTVTHQGGVSGAIGLWIGAHSMSVGKRPTFYIPISDACSNCDEIALALLEHKYLKSSPTYGEPQFLSIYVSEPDDEEHEFGVDSPQAKQAIAQLDAMIGRFVDGVKARGLDRRVNIVVVSDHGQISFASQIQTINIQQFIDYADLASAPTSTGFNPVMQLWPQPGKEAKIFAQLSAASPHLHVYRAGSFPAEWHCCSLDRSPPIAIQAELGWMIIDNQNRDAPTFGQNRSIGFHAYDPSVREMHPLFIAAGPAFKAGEKLPAFENVDIYSLLAEIMHLRPVATDGTIKPFCDALVVRPESCRAPQP